MNAPLVFSVLCVRCRQLVVYSAFVFSRLVFSPLASVEGAKNSGKKDSKKSAVNKEPVDSGAWNLGKKGKEKRA